MEKQKDKTMRIKRICFGIFCILFISLVAMIAIKTKVKQQEVQPEKSDAPSQSTDDARIVRILPLSAERVKYVKAVKEQYLKPKEELSDVLQTEDEVFDEAFISEGALTDEINREYSAELYEDRYLAMARYLETTETETEEVTTEESEIVVDQSHIFTLYTTKEGREREFHFSEEMQEWTWQMCQKYGLPYRTILGILGAETNWNEDPDHTEEHGGQTYIGIGCLSKKWHEEKYADKGIDIYSVKGNIEALCDLIKGHYDVFEDITLAVMAYNMGRNGARAKIADGIYETGYTQIVDAYAESFR